MEPKRRRQAPRSTPGKAAAAVAPPPPPALFGGAWRKHRWAVAALWALTLAAYSNSFRDGFALDNASIILRDTRVRAATAENLHLIWTQEYWYNITTTGLYRPFTTLSYLLNYAILGNRDHPAGYHWINFALHAVNVLLVYFLGLVVLRETAPALAVAAVWAVHPVLTESVTNIVGRADLLAGFGVLAGLLCYVQSTATSGRRKWLWLAAAFATTIGLFSKESAVVVVAAVAIYDLAFGAAPLRARAAGYLAIAAPLAAFLSVRDQVLSRLMVGVVPFGDNPLLGADFWTARFTAVKVIGKYLWLLLWPGRLSSDYSYNQIPLVAWRFNNWENWKAVIALAACAGAIMLAIYGFRRKRPLFFFVAFFFATLSPTSNLVIRIGTIMAERFLYLPAIGFAGCLVLALQFVLRLPKAQQVALAVICVAFAARTWARNLDWYDDDALWASARGAAPASFKVHTILADQWQAKPEGLDRAIAEIDRALAIIDGLPDEENTVRPYALAGTCYRRKGDAVAPDPGSASWYGKAAAVLERGQRIDLATLEAIRRVNSRRVSASGWAPLYLELGRVRLRLSQPRKAIEALDYGRTLRPDAEFFQEMSAAYRALGEPQQAAIALMEGISIDPAHAQFASALVDLYKQTEPGSCALRNMGNSTGVNLDCPLVHGEVCTASRNVALLYQKRGKAALAAGTRASAVRDLGCPAGMFP